MTVFFCYPKGLNKALTMSYDDGVVQDRRLVDIFNKYGLKGSFHLNSARLGSGGCIAPEEVAELYHGHEVSCHGATHALEAQIPRSMVMTEVWNDRLALENLCGYQVCGMSYPNDSRDPETTARLREAGIVCSRTVESTGSFALPQDFLLWHPTCHHLKMLEILPHFLEYPYPWGMPLFFVWGHSYEFDNDNNWAIMEEFAERASGKEDVWYATNIEICRYLKAIHDLVASADGKSLTNFSSITVWFRFNEKLYSVASGETVRL